MIKANYPRLDVDQLAAVIQESIGKQQATGVGPADQPRSSEPSLAEPLMLRLQPDFHPKTPGDAYELHDLLRFHDRVFIENAYRAILGRYPSEAEYSSSLTNLRSGRINKIDVLAILRFSPEGNAKGIRINGLGNRAFIRRIGRIPIIGYLVRLAIALVRLPNQVRDQREFDSYLLVQNQEIASFLNNVNAHATGLGNQAIGALTELEQKQQASVARQDDHEGQITALAEQVQTVTQNTSRQFETLEREWTQRLDASIETKEQEWSQRLDDSVKTQQREVSQRFEHSQAALQREFEATITTAIRQVRGELSELLSERVEAKQAEINKLAAELQRLHQILQLTRAEVTIQKTTVAPSGTDVPTTEVVTSVLDGFYAALEDRFRGTPEDIKKQFRFYLPYIRQACNEPNALVLDLGCGRGEWLQLLKDENINAQGVDTNQIFLMRCRELGLTVEEQDVLSYLSAVKSNSISAITGFHIIEHLEFGYLVRLLAEVMRVLKPAGLVLFETPNPENVLVGSNFFYIDPSHRHPLPSQLMELLFETRGFDRIEVKNLHPWASGRVEERGALAERVNGLFYGPMDYAIVGWKLDA